MKIFLADAFDASLPGRLAAFGEVLQDAARLPEAEVLLVRSKTKVTREFLRNALQLQLVIRGGVGLDNVDIEACRERGIEVRNTPRASSVAVAELTMALMLAVPNQLMDAHVSMQDGRWLKKELKRTELFQKTLALLGAGLIGTEVARRAQAFGMRVIAYDPNLPNHALVELYDSLEEALAQADYVSLHLPLTPETRHVIDKHALGQMKEGAVLINTARGDLIVEADVAAALDSGRLRAYATDVYRSDPPAEGCPLRSAPRVLMTPHLGGSSNENLLRIGESVVEILNKRVRAQHRAAVAARQGQALVMA